MASSIARFDIEKLEENIVQNHGGSKQVGLKQLGSKQVGFKQLGHKQFEVEPHGAQGYREAEVFQVSNDDDAVAQRWLKDKQLEERANTDCLVKEHEKVHLDIKVGADIIVTGVPGQEGLEGNVAGRKKRRSQEAKLGNLLKKHFKTLSLDKSRSPDFDLFFDQEEYSEEEVAETMAETMEQYMSKTRADYGSGVARPKIKDKGPRYTNDFPLKEEGKTLEEAYYTQFGAPFQRRGYRATAPGFYQRNNTNSSYQERRQSMEDTLSKFMSESAKRHETVKYPKGIAENMLVGIGKFIFLIDLIILDMPKDIKVPLILGRPFLSTARARIDVFKRKITLRVGEEKIIFKSVKLASSLIKRVYMLGLRERMELDLEARLIGETLVLNRSLDPFFEDYIELNNLNVPLELRIDQVDDLMPNIEEGEVVEEFRARNDARMVSKIFRYPSDCDHDKKIRMDCAYNLKFSYMIDFEILEDMDAYRDERMGDVIFGEPFLREVGINAKRFDGMNTINNSNEEVTYQMVRSHPRFKHHTNEQCNKIPPLLKVSEKDKMNRISHSYRKLKGFYKGVLNLGPDFIRDAKMEEWLTHGHISMHEME
ncbi:homeodomain-like protein [Tanacetum coccineum]